MLLNPVPALPSFSDDVSDAQITVVMYELLTGHFDFFRNRGFSVFGRFLIGPQEFKPENQNSSRLFLRERRQTWEDPTCLTRWLFQTRHQSCYQHPEGINLWTRNARVLHLLFEQAGVGSDPLHTLSRHVWPTSVSTKTFLLCLTFLKHWQRRNQAGCLRLPQKLKPKLNEPR